MGTQYELFLDDRNHKALDACGVRTKCMSHLQPQSTRPTGHQSHLPGEIEELLDSSTLAHVLELLIEVAGLGLGLGFRLVPDGTILAVF